MAIYQEYRVIGTEPPTIVTLTDAEILDRFPPQVELTADKQTLIADGTDFVTVTMQLKSVPLNDGQVVNLERVHRIRLGVAETVIELETDTSGRVIHELDFVDAGCYPVKVYNLSSNTLEIEAV